jgi:ATP adenylyltransferase
VSSALAPGDLPAAAGEAIRRARAAGALQPIASEADEIAEAGVRFVVRILGGRPPVDAGGGDRGDPFADPDPNLIVGALSDTHLCLLNKFPVLERHLLLVTRAFAPQEGWLDAADWAALAAGLAAIDGLGFYNGGPAAGASQPHKHLQLVPLPLGTVGPVPIAPWIDSAPPGPGPLSLPAPFPHAFVRLDASAWRDPEAIARRADAALAAVGVWPLPGPHGPRQSAPYDLLATRGWLLAVPRARGKVDGIPINALGFAGSFVVNDAAGLGRLRERGPLAVLRAAAG